MSKYYYCDMPCDFSRVRVRTFIKDHGSELIVAYERKDDESIGEFLCLSTKLSIEHIAKKIPKYCDKYWYSISKDLFDEIKAAISEIRVGEKANYILVRKHE